MAETRRRRGAVLWRVTPRNRDELPAEVEAAVRAELKIC
jgi:hypothetical protein